MKGLVAKLIKPIILFLIRYCEKRNKVVDIMDRDATGKAKPELYLRRYLLFSSSFACIYIHRFFKSDDETHHDHPWNFLTYIVDGKYKEEVLVSEIYAKYKVWPAKFSKQKNVREKGSIAYRRATDIHRVILYRNYKPEEFESAPLTICFIGPRVREWGFWGSVNSKKPKSLNKKWTIWTEFLNIDPQNPKFKGHR